MKTVILTLVMTLVLTLAGAGAFIYAGVFNVAANEPHWAMTHWVLGAVRERSIKVRAAGIAVPADLGGAKKLAAAAGHFVEHCATCHGGPGLKRGEFAAGMYPAPPVLKDVSSRYTPAEIFWILKNGIKMSGMPSMADDGDEMLWATVALLMKFPQMPADDFNDLWLEAQAGAAGGRGPMNTGGSGVHKHD